MKSPFLRAAKYLAPASLFAIILVVATLSLRQPSVNASPPPPDVPDFAGEVTSNTLSDTQGLSQETVVSEDPPVGWITVFEEDFEDEEWDSQWLNVSQGGDWYRYGTRPIQNTLDPFSTKVAWAVGKNPEGEPELDPAVNGYPSNVNAWLIAGPFDFSDVYSINLAFEYSFDADTGDTIAIQASTNLPDFSGPEKNGGDGGWVPADIDLSGYAGEPAVYIAFIFKSDDSTNEEQKLGFLLDNVKLDVRYASKTHLPYISFGVTPTPDVTPTPTITPGDNYYKGFTNNIKPWDKVRSSDGAESKLTHSDSCEGDVCGFLTLEVKKSNEYVIVSPKVPAKPYPYNIETEAKIRSSRQDGDSYGIIFGASTNGQECPVDDYSTCFNHYYEMRARYRDSGGDQWIEFKLVRVEGHDENNQPIGTDLIGWTKIEEDPDALVEWDVRVKENADIVIRADDEKVGEVNDSTFLNNPFFGLVVTSGTNGASEVKFAYYEVK